MKRSLFFSSKKYSAYNYTKIAMRHELHEDNVLNSHQPILLLISVRQQKRETRKNDVSQTSFLNRELPT